MGYCEKVPYHHKLHKVIFTATTTNPKGDKVLLDQSDKDVKRLSYLEYRSGLRLVAPRLVANSSDMDNQMKKEPLSVKSDKVLTNFSDNKYHKSINALNRAHAILLTVGKKGSKSKAIHYEIARNEFLHLTSKIPVKDGQGLEYVSEASLPNPIQDFCRKQFRFPKGEQKRDADSAMEVDSQAEEPAKKKPTTPTASPSRRGAIRKSGRGRGRGGRGASSSTGSRPPKDGEHSGDWGESRVLEADQW
jgi:hypothetical protein